MSIFDQNADVAAISPELDRLVATLAAALRDALPNALNGLQNALDGLQIVATSDDGSPVVTAKKIIVKITKGIK
jgi:hypothetical protein